MKRRIVPCTVRPLTPREVRAHTRRRAQAIEQRVGLPVGRRSFLRGSTALAVGSATTAGLGGGLGASSGCGDPVTTLVVALTAVQLAKAVFTLVEEIRGSYVMENPGDADVRTEIVSDLMTGNEPIFAAFNPAYEQIVGQPPRYGVSMGITDSNIYVAEGNIPTIAFGPKGSRHHMAGEYVEAGTLEKVARVYAETAVSFLSNR